MQQEERHFKHSSWKNKRNLWNSHGSRGDEVTTSAEATTVNAPIKLVGVISREDEVLKIGGGKGSKAIEDGLLHPFFHNLSSLMLEPLGIILCLLGIEYVELS